MERLYFKKNLHGNPQIVDWHAEESQSVVANIGRKEDKDREENERRQTHSYYWSSNSGCWLNWSMFFMIAIVFVLPWARICFPRFGTFAILSICLFQRPVSDLASLCGCDEIPARNSEMALSWNEEVKMGLQQLQWLQARQSSTLNPCLVCTLNKRN